MNVAAFDPSDAVVRRLCLDGVEIMVVSPPAGAIWSRPVRAQVRDGCVAGALGQIVIVLAETVDLTIAFAAR